MRFAHNVVTCSKNKPVCVFSFFFFFEGPFRSLLREASPSVQRLYSIFEVCVCVCVCVWKDICAVLT